MLATGSCARRVSNRAASSFYICPDCESRARFATRARSSWRARLDSPRTGASRRRQFGTANSQKASVEPAPPIVDPLHSPSARGRAAKDASDPGSNIRAHLKSWATQNTKMKQQEADDAHEDTAKLKRLSLLPNSLFIEDANLRNEDPDDDQADETMASSMPDIEDFPLGDNFAFFNSIKPGDLLWWVPARGTSFARAGLAIYLGAAGHQRQFMLEDGRWVLEMPRPQQSPIYANFTSQAEVDRLRVHVPFKPVEGPHPDFPGMNSTHSFAGDMPAELARPIMGRIGQFADDMLTWRRQNLGLLNSVHERIADQDEYLTLTFDDVAARLTGLTYSEIPPAALFAIYRTLSRNYKSVITLKKRSYSALVSVVFVPKRLSSKFDQVCNWAREYQESAAGAATGKDVSTDLGTNPLTAFIAKARRLILSSRTHRSPTTLGSLGPSSLKPDIAKNDAVPTKPNAETFDHNDSTLIDFLWDCYVRLPAPSTNRNTAIASLILRAVGAYPKIRLDQSMGRLLLQEIGALPPWFMAIDYDMGIDLPLGARASAQMKKVYSESIEFCNSIGLDTNSDPYRLPDSMADLREDLGDLPVYVIDPSDSIIREDGVSIEPHKGIAGAVWIHNHAADPTAFIDSNHVLAQRARKLTMPIYHHSTMARVFPEPFCYAYSLQKGGPAFTVSTLLDKDANVLDIKLRSTVVHNVIYLPHHAVERSLNRLDYEAAVLELGSVPVPHSAETMSPATGSGLEVVSPYRSDLEKIQTYLEARELRRREAVKIPPDWVQPSTLSQQAYSHVWGSKDEDKKLHKTLQYLGDPAIQLKVSRYMTKVQLSESHKHVTYTSLLADLGAESAGKWFADRNIPAVFFGSVYIDGFGPEKLNNLKPGEPASYPEGKMSVTPFPHVHKCHASHLLVCNPLRRFTDMIAHWNANAYRLAESKGHVQPEASLEPLQLPFPRSDIEQFLRIEGAQMSEYAKGVRTGERQHWTTQALFRAFHFKEAQLPEVWDVHVTRLTHKEPNSHDDTGLRGVLQPFGNVAVILSSPQGYERTAKIGDFLPVKLELVDSVKYRVFVRVIGPPSQEHTQREPLQLRGGARQRVAAATLDSTRDARTSSVATNASTT